MLIFLSYRPPLQTSSEDFLKLYLSPFEKPRKITNLTL